jgi:hypothetical protein
MFFGKSAIPQVFASKQFTPILTAVSGHYRLELLIPIGFGYVRGWTEPGAFASIGFARFMRAIQTKTHAISSKFQGHFRGFQHGSDPFRGHYSGHYLRPSQLHEGNSAPSRRTGFFEPGVL